MKTKLLSLLFLLLPIYLFSQNYEKEGDDLFAQAQYEQAEKKYKAAIAISGESQTIKQKQDKCTKCKSLLANAQTAEKESRYSDAAKYYSSLYAIHSLAKYQSKANAMKNKLKQEQIKNTTRSGTFGDNLRWTLHNGVLTISGEGIIESAEKTYVSFPWSYEENNFKDDIKSIIIKDGIKSIGWSAFSGCRYLTSVTIPNSVKYIGEEAFLFCSRLTNISIPNSVTSIGSSAFYECSSLTSLEIPNGVTKIENSVFYHCTNLTCITIPDHITSIGNYAFCQCNISAITIPQSVKYIEKGAFVGCKSLNIKLPQRFKGKVDLSSCKSVTYY